MATPQPPDTFLARLHANCASSPSSPALTFYSSVPAYPAPIPSSSKTSFTYLEALSCIHALLPRLRALNLPAGSRVLLVYPPSLSFLFAFVACQLCSLVPVPVFPPDPRSLRATVTQFRSIAESAGARHVLTNGLYGHVKKVSDLAAMFSSASRWPALTWVVTDSSEAKDRAFLKEAPGYSPNEDQPEACFLQYTSGSTSMPKGVTITQASLAANLSSISASLRTSRSTVCCSWLPQYHDMGLIGSYLGLLYCGGEGHYLSPLTFITSPLSYLRLWSECGATHLQMPNFALRLCVKRFKAKPLPLDLSKTQHIINAAEPVDHRTCHEFLAAFAASGLPQDKLFPTYGLAENTVFVCSGGSGAVLYGEEEKGRIAVKDESELGAPPGEGRAFVGCGNPAADPGIEVRIVDPEALSACEEGVVGEIWCAGASKSGGYFGFGDENDASFRAAVEGEEGGPGYLRTGDLGFVRGGELYVSGRLKDLIIVRGRNYYPQDVEATVEAFSDDVRPGCVGCFVVAAGDAGGGAGGGGVGEDVGVVAEVRDAKKAAASAGTDSEVAGNGVDPALIRAMPEAEIEEKLKDHISQLVATPSASLDMAAPLTTLADSMSISQFKGLLEGAYAVSLSDEYLFREDTTLAKVVEIVKLGYAPDDSIPPPSAEGGSISPEVGAARQPPPQGPALAPPGLCCTVS
ncbi:hypothetical protein TeGR_g11840 [Tetraparma gracilis]|uniref:AMP-dependent synthetase/ligase domain-containing protein n=1 Tax=Tetraparma gracilis TaxID=2962635 RepID=A0ABQ6N5K3_9STRA|nr:hypothetical protein TeGR_g11840 [Tetraparma gracilis]